MPASKEPNVDKGPRFSALVCSTEIRVPSRNMVPNDGTGAIQRLD